MAPEADPAIPFLFIIMDQHPTIQGDAVIAMADGGAPLRVPGTGRNGFLTDPATGEGMQAGMSSIRFRHFIHSGYTKVEKASRPVKMIATGEKAPGQGMTRSVEKWDAALNNGQGPAGIGRPIMTPNSYRYEKPQDPVAGAGNPS